MNDIFVTSPLLPPLKDLTQVMKDIWNRKWITNNGHYHQELEKRLAEYLGVPYISLMSNGTLALMTAIQVLDLHGEIITTPYSFCATSHSILLSDCSPVFTDIDPLTGNIDSSKIEEAITEKTCAIMPVHVYGNPCETKKIKKIAEKHNLKVIYDAAHAFGVKENGKSILNEGDLSCLSFHATKTYNTVEGGAIVCHTKEMKDKIDCWKDFGIEDESTISLAGMNCKMDEIRSAVGLENLKIIDNALLYRKETALYYRKLLKDIKGIKLLPLHENVTYNYSYFPVFVEKNVYGHSSDELYAELKKNHIFARRYFWPLISNLKVYKDIPSVKKENLPVANRMSEEVLCLPIHHLLEKADVERIVSIIRDFKAD